MSDRSWRLRKRVIELRASGMTIARIAQKLVCTTRRVYQILAEERKEIEARQRAG